MIDRYHIQGTEIMNNQDVHIVISKLPQEFEE